VFRKEIAVRTPGDPAERDLSWLDQSDLCDLSRDGKTLLITELGPGGGTHYGVFLRKTDGSPAVRLGDGIAGSLSPDAAWVLALRKESGPRGWYHMERIPTGPGQNVAIPVGDLNVQEGRALPPAGKKIFFWAFDPKHEEHGYVLDLESGRPPRMWLPKKTRVTGFTSDGRSALVQQEDGSWAIVSLEGETIRSVTGIGEGELPCCWTADGRSLYVVRTGPNNESLEVERLEIAPGHRQPWKTLAPSDRAGLFGVSAFHVSADDATYAYGVERIVADDLFVIAGLR